MNTLEALQLTNCELSFKALVYGSIPAIIMITVIICSMVIWKKRIDSPLDFLSSKEEGRVESIFYSVDRPFGISVRALMWGYVFFAIIMLTRGVISDYVKMMVNCGKAYNELMFGLMVLVVTCAVVLVSIDKKYYIVFSIQDVLEENHFCKDVVFLTTFCLLASLSSIATMDKYYEDSFASYLFVFSTVISLFYSIKALRTIIKVLFISRQEELKLLDVLYRRFWVGRIDTSRFKKRTDWSMDAIEVNLDYIIERYVRICQDWKIKRIASIEFATTVGIHMRRWYGKAKRRYYMLICVVTLICLLLYRADCGCYSLAFFAPMLFACLITVLFSLVFKNCFQYAVTNLFMDVWGYHIITSENSEKLISRVPIIGWGVYKEFIKRMNSLNAFFYIILEYLPENSNSIKDELNRLIQSLIGIKTNEWNNRAFATVVIMPVFIAGYFLYCKNPSVDSVKTAYKMIINEKNRECFSRALYGQLVYLTSVVDKKMRVTPVNYKTYSNYVKWLEE